MVNINVKVEANEPDKLKDLLNHVVKEITDLEYNIEVNGAKFDAQVDGEWICTTDGRYNWSRND